MFDLITVGHFAIDIIFSPKIFASTPTLGGSPTYVSLSARELDAKVSVISKIGTDFPNEYIALLKGNGVNLSGLRLVKGVPSTSFILKYSNGTRKLQLTSRAPPILMGDIPSNLQARIIHVAPIANELSWKAVHKLRTSTDILSLDPQGFVRKFDNEGYMHLEECKNLCFLEWIDLYKSTVNEVKVVTGLSDLRLAVKKIQDYGVKIVIVTMGKKGSMLFFEGSSHQIPPARPRSIYDPTGAGDTFIGAFLAEYVQRKDPVWCSCVGCVASSFVIEGIGPSVFGKKKEIYMRATKIYEKELMQS